jgi:hypothetical protein
MFTPGKAPILTYRTSENQQSGFGFGYLVQCSDGSVWCVLKEENIEKPTALAGAFQIDLSRIRPQPDTGADRRLYLYEGEPAVVRGAPRKIPSVVGYYPGN